MRSKPRAVFGLLVFVLLVTPLVAKAGVPAPCDADLIFRDGFEAGDDAAWKAPAALAAARAAADGATDLDVAGVVVTYVKPSIGGDAAGFFVQATFEGPALFVAVDPILLSPVPVAGDYIRFTIDQMGTSLGMRRATAISGFARVDQNRCLAPLTQDLSVATDVVTNVDGYESERIDLDATVAGAFSAAGTGYVAAQIHTTGLSGDGNFRVRVPATLQDAIDLATNCSVQLRGTPLWRANSVAQPSAWRAEDLLLTECPDPRLLTAVATSALVVQLTFDRHIDSASVNPNGSQFVISGGAGVGTTGATVSGRTVTLNVTAVDGPTLYTVTVADTVTDLLGAGVDPAHNSKNFFGF